jgi:hypothetical protein
MLPTAEAGAAMAKGYSKDLRVRVLAIVESGESAREAARLLNIGASDGNPLDRALDDNG